MSSGASELAWPYYDSREPEGDTTDSFTSETYMSREGFTIKERRVVEQAVRLCILRRQWEGEGHGTQCPHQSADDYVSEHVPQGKRQRQVLTATIMRANEQSDVRLWNRKNGAHTEAA